MSLVLCTMCPSTATHYPRVFFQHGTRRMGILLDTPRCEGHRTMIVEGLLNRHELAVYTERFALEYGEPPDMTRTRASYIQADSHEVRNFLLYLEKSKARRAQEERRTPIVVEVVPDEEFSALEDDERKPS